MQSNSLILYYRAQFFKYLLLFWNSGLFRNLDFHSNFYVLQLGKDYFLVFYFQSLNSKYLLKSILSYILSFVYANAK